MKISVHFTIPSSKLPAAQGFSLLECLIAMFILALLVGSVLPHQARLARTQAVIVQDWESQRQRQNQALLSAYPHPPHWKGEP